MKESDDIPEPEEKLHEILTKILVYQYGLSTDRAVDLDELLKEGALTEADNEFLEKHSVNYKPHRLSDHHGMDMLEMETANGCVFIGPAGPPLTQRSVRFDGFALVVENFLRLPKPKDELLMCVEFPEEEDGMGISPGFVSFTFPSGSWRKLLPRLREVALKLNLQRWQDEEIQDIWHLSLRFELDPRETAEAVVTLLREGCGFSDDREVRFSAGALDED